MAKSKTTKQKVWKLFKKQPTSATAPKSANKHIDDFAGKSNKSTAPIAEKAAAAFIKNGAGSATDGASPSVTSDKNKGKSNRSWFGRPAKGGKKPSRKCPPHSQQQQQQQQQEQQQQEREELEREELEKQLQKNEQEIQNETFMTEETDIMSDGDENVSSGLRVDIIVDSPAGFKQHNSETWCAFSDLESHGAVEASVITDEDAIRSSREGFDDRNVSHNEKARCSNPHSNSNAPPFENGDDLFCEFQVDEIDESFHSNLPTQVSASRDWSGNASAFQPFPTFEEASQEKQRSLWNKKQGQRTDGTGALQRARVATSEVAHRDKHTLFESVKSCSQKEVDALSRLAAKKKFQSATHEIVLPVSLTDLSTLDGTKFADEDPSLILHQTQDEPSIEAQVAPFDATSSGGSRSQNYLISDTFSSSGELKKSARTLIFPESRGDWKDPWKDAPSIQTASTGLPSSSKSTSSSMSVSSGRKWSSYREVEALRSNEPTPSPIPKVRSDMASATLETFHRVSRSGSAPARSPSSTSLDNDTLARWHRDAAGPYASHSHEMSQGQRDSHTKFDSVLVKSTQGSFDSNRSNRSELLSIGDFPHDEASRNRGSFSDDAGISHQSEDAILYLSSDDESDKEVATPAPGRSICVASLESSPPEPETDDVGIECGANFSEEMGSVQRFESSSVHMETIPEERSSACSPDVSREDTDENVQDTATPVRQEHNEVPPGTINEGPSDCSRAVEQRLHAPLSGNLACEELDESRALSLVSQITPNDIAEKRERSPSGSEMLDAGTKIQVSVAPARSPKAEPECLVKSPNHDENMDSDSEVESNQTSPLDTFRERLKQRAVELANRRRLEKEQRSRSPAPSSDQAGYSFLGKLGMAAIDHLTDQFDCACLAPGNDGIDNGEDDSLLTYDEELTFDEELTYDDEGTFFSHDSRDGNQLRIEEDFEDALEWADENLMSCGGRS